MKAEETNEIEFPTIINNVHESCFRSYQILEKVKIMLNRDDSKETIMETIEMMETKNAK